MAELAELQKRRGIIKGHLTRQDTFIANFDGSKGAEIPIRLSKLNDCWHEFEQIQFQIEEIDGSKKQLDEREKFYTDFFDIFGRIESLRITSGPAPTAGRSAHAQSSPKPEVKLPAMEIPSFYGSYIQWLEFHDTFNALVDANTTLSDIQKFYYLKGALKGRAAEVIHSLEVSSANYKEAWALLKERFENKKLIALSHIESLYGFPNMTRESYVDLRKFVDEIRKDLRALKALGLPVEHWDSLLIYMFELKLNNITKRELQRQCAVDTFATIDEFLKFLVNKCAVLETSGKKNNFQDGGSKGKPPRESATYQKPTQVFGILRGSNCVVCESPEHGVQNCKDFIRVMSLQHKRECINKNNLCWNCLRPGHGVRTCNSQGCRKCNRRHNSLLHTTQAKEGENSNSQGQRKQTSNQGEETNNGSQNEENNSFNGHIKTIKGFQAESKESEVSEVLLSTAIIKVQDQQGRLHACRALLDCGSQSSFMTKELQEKLSIPRKKVNISVLGIGQGITNISNYIHTRIHSNISDFDFNTNFLLIDKISHTIPSINIDVTELKIPEGIVLADDSFGKVGKVDVLLGASLFWDILGNKKIRLNDKGLTAHDTKLGYVVAGPVSQGFDSNKGKRKMQGCYLASNLTVQEQLEKFWQLEEVGREKWLTKEEEECEGFFEKTTIRLQDGKFGVKLPFRTGSPNLGHSLEVAVKRYGTMERKLGRDRELEELYHAFMQEYIDLGHMSKVAELNSLVSREGPNIYYLPHHPVLKQNSLTTKLRVVFDASCATNNGVSLNNILLNGPKLQDDIFDTLLRFRRHAVVITADVEKMSRQVWIANEDRDFQRILWRFGPNEPISVYRLNTITYGMTCSGYLAVKCMQQLAMSSPKDLSAAASGVLKDFYMDDLLTGTDDVETAKQLRKDISQLLAEGGFVLRKWNSNNQGAIESDEGQDIEHYISGENNSSKTLGIRWNSRTDTLHYDCPEEYANNAEQKITKRHILSLISQVFDPLGLIAPTIVKAKLIMQGLWKKKLGWDEEVPEDILSQWIELREEFKRLGTLQIKRYVTCVNPKNVQLHGFCDASQKAYGACIFVRSVDREGTCHVQLLCSKSRVAPLKVVSLPRLVLCGALLLAKLTRSVLQSTEFKGAEVRYWSDASIVLCWLAGEPANWTTFVANRTAEIQTITKGQHWGHVPTRDNPADVVSRGLDCDNLRETRLWWQGPDWLSMDEEYWPRDNKLKIDVVPEQRAIRKAFVVSKSVEMLDGFSNFGRLHRSVAYCLRFFKNCRKGVMCRQVGPLIVEELDEAWIAIIKLIQGEFFKTELKLLKNSGKIEKSSKIVSLNPFIDEKGLLRVGGRLAKSNLSYDQKFPVILPNKHRLTRLIILHEHYKHLHAGPHALLAQIRLRYWPISGRQIIRSVLRGCIMRFRVKPRSITPFMGELPKARITPCRPFSNCGVDYAGPLMIKASKGRKPLETKAYISVFVCLVSKAVHLELVEDLTTKSFLNCFKRFIARRGLCNNIYSDNATNFTGANNELQDLIRFLQNPKNQSAFSDYFSQLSIKWHFIPPRSPHFGGLWESTVKSVKYHIKRVVGEQKLTFEELYTVLTQVESCLNSRPLSPLSESPDDLDVLTPGHFLIGTSLSALPQEDLTKHKINRLQRYHLLTQMVQGFWNRWSQEYLGQLQQRTKWCQQNDNVNIGEMVIVRDDNLPPLKWQLGRIVELHPGSDGVCRVVSIKTASGVFKRAVTRLCLLPFEQENVTA